MLADCVLNQLAAAVRVRVVLFLRDSEGTEFALHATDVRLIEIEVLDEVDTVVAAAETARQIGELAEREDVVALHERHAVVEVEPFAGFHLLADRGERVCSLE